MTQPNPTEKTYLDLMKGHVEQLYLQAAAAFHKNPGGEAWTHLEDMMWAWQAVNRGGLNESRLIQIINTKPMTYWIAELVAIHKGSTE